MLGDKKMSRFHGYNVRTRELALNNKKADSFCKRIYLLKFSTFKGSLRVFSSLNFACRAGTGIGLYTVGAVITLL